MGPQRRKLSRPKASGTSNINLTTTQVNSSPNREDQTAPTAVHEITMLKTKLEAEKEKGNLREETISILKADKAYLQDELAKKDALIRSALPTMKPTKKRAFPVSTSSEDTAPEDPTSSSLSDSSAENIKVKAKHRPKKKCQRKSSGSSEQPSGSGLVHSRVRMRNTKGIILRYMAALEAFKKGQSMKAAFAAIGVD